MQRLTVKEFFERYPDDDTCLEHIMEVRYGLRHVCGACGVEATFHKITGRRAYACAHCGTHLYPCAGTIFEDSRTSLVMWFYAIYLFVVTRHGVSGKELERALGVTYKTAWRMGHQIRTLMAKANGFEMLQGHVELDEAYVGGRTPHHRGGAWKHKTVVFGMKERGGRVAAEVIPNIRKPTLREATLRNVKPGSIISTDELMSYSLLTADGYEHGKVNHRAKEYVWNDERTGISHHTNNIESFWRLFKKSVASTHIHIAPKYVDHYVKEFTFRQNHRAMRNAMFDLLIGAV
jgi:transposase-like protein